MCCTWDLNLRDKKQPSVDKVLQENLATDINKPKEHIITQDGKAV
jgi:hypothetical protein